MSKISWEAYDKIALSLATAQTLAEAACEILQHEGRGRDSVASLVSLACSNIIDSSEQLKAAYDAGNAEA